jgi:hypothetical protein
VLSLAKLDSREVEIRRVGLKIGEFRESDQYPIISDCLFSDSPQARFTHPSPELQDCRRVAGIPVRPGGGQGGGKMLPRRRHAMPPSKFAVKFWTYAPALRAGSIGLGYSFDKRVFRQVFVVLTYNCFGLLLRRKPPLNLQIFISSEAFDNSAFFYQQLEFIWLIGV